MLKKITLSIVCFAGLFSNVVMAQNQKLKLKVMTYNIRHASPPAKPSSIDVDTVASVIKKYGPDIVAIQEVDVNTGRAGKINEAKELGEKTGMYYEFGKAINYDGGEYGVAILSKYPFDSVRTYQLPSAHAKAERRAVILAYLNCGHGNKMLFVCTHLDAEKADDSRLLQIHTIDSILKSEKLPVLLAGDLNSEAGSSVINFLDQNFKRTCTSNCAYTIPSDKPTQTIDFIAFRKTDSFKSLNHFVLPEAYPSDHLPVLAELSLSFKK